jgi:hypothetical protein
MDSYRMGDNFPYNGCKSLIQFYQKKNERMMAIAIVVAVCIAVHEIAMHQKDKV